MGVEGRAVQASSHASSCCWIAAWSQRKGPLTVVPAWCPAGEGQALCGPHPAAEGEAGRSCQPRTSRACGSCRGNCCPCGCTAPAGAGAGGCPLTAPRARSARSARPWQRWLGCKPHAGAVHAAGDRPWLPYPCQPRLDVRSPWGIRQNAHMMSAQVLHMQAASVP